MQEIGVMIQQKVRKKKRPLLKRRPHFQYYQLKITELNKTRSLQSLAMLKCESRPTTMVIIF